MALVRTLHREGVALLALAQCSLTKLDSSDLVHKRGDRSSTEQRENQRARGAVVRDVAPALERDAFFACDRDYQGNLRNMRDAYETWLIVDGPRLKSGGSEIHPGRLGKLAPQGPPPPPSAGQ